MKLIVGLGNPGFEYEKTRHNIGFSLIDKIALSKEITFDRKKFNAEYSWYVYNDEKIILVKPLSYMNLSGNVVEKFVRFYKIDLKDILIIHDDLDMKFGRVKIVYDSSNGGHNGVKDIEKCLGSKCYSRLKIGIGRDRDIKTSDFVLSDFSADEIVKLDNIFDSLVHVVDDFCDLNIEKLMSKYNRK